MSDQREMTQANLGSEPPSYATRLSQAWLGRELLSHFPMRYQLSDGFSDE